MIDDFQITVSKPYRATVADAPAQAIVASMPEFAGPLVNNVYLMALLLAKLRKDEKRLRFVEAKITLNGYRLTVIPKGKLPHLLDQGVRPHSLAPLAPKIYGKSEAFREYRRHLRADWMQKMELRPIRKWPMHPGFPGRHFMPAALRVSLPAMEKILDRNTATYMAKQEIHG